METKPYLSVIIPAYREADRIGKNLMEIENYLASKTYEYEVLVVTDGSPDDTAAVARTFANQVNNLRDQEGI